MHLLVNKYIATVIKHLQGTHMYLPNAKAYSKTEKKLLTENISVVGLDA
jgi:hypothetical protein